MLWNSPAMTDFRACGTIMGLAGLTAVFGMGTGGPRQSGRREGDGAVRSNRDASQFPDGYRKHVSV